MASQQNISLVKRLFDEFFNKGNASIADQFFTNDVKLNDPAAAHFRGGLQGYKELENIYRQAFPNKNTKIDDIFATEDRVIVRWTTQGTQKGDLEGIAPTGKNCKICGISIYKFMNGKISEIYQSWDRLGLLEQIGAVEQTAALHR